MKWYAGHALMVIRKTKHRQGVYPVYENVNLVWARSPRHACTQAVKIARDEQKLAGAVKTEGVITRPMRIFAPGFGAGAVGGYAVLRVDPAVVA